MAKVLTDFRKVIEFQTLRQFCDQNSGRFAVSSVGENGPEARLVFRSLVGHHDFLVHLNGKTGHHLLFPLI